jgi:tRNA threonylcarbamoyladenosine biosynthesis protein TsaB
MARILLIETATEVCSAAIAVHGEVVAIAEELHSQNHAALLTLQIEQCVKDSGIPLSNLDAVAVSRGPGSYTSLRVGASVAKGICYALGKPLIAVDTLLALAAAARSEVGNWKLEIDNPDVTTNFQFPISNFLLLPMLDARRQEVWLAAYDPQLRPLATAQPLILENDLFEKFVRAADPAGLGEVLIVAGNGSLKLENVPASKRTVFSSIKNCSARHLVPLAEQFFQDADFQNVAYFEPFYMKAPNITTPSKAPF